MATVGCVGTCLMGLVNFCSNLPQRIRVSFGSAIVLGLANAKLDAAPTTAYLMTYHKEKCAANCGFCPQARESTARADMLSRVSWPDYQTQEALKRIVDAVEDGKIRRVCIQALNYPRAFDDLIALVRAIKHLVKVPISVSVQPLNRENLCQLANAGVERIGIPLDAATKEVFERTKGAMTGGPYRWEKQWQLLSQAIEVFGKDSVSTHLIVGLGETEKEMISTIQRCTDMGILPALFAFTPVRGTTLGNRAQPPIGQYRRIQVARYLILHGVARWEKMSFDEKGNITDFGVSNRRLLQIVETRKPFVTSGCADCNRPFYNEKPSGPIYNFPEKPASSELPAIKKQLVLKRHNMQE